MSKRFVVDEKNIENLENNIIVKGKEVHHINVLRYKMGDRLYINNYNIEILKLEKDTLVGKILGSMPKCGEPNVNITLIQSYLKSDKMEYVVQKAVELGVKKIIPVITKNTVVKLDEKDKVKKTERLSKIAKEAIEQCGRTDSVLVENITNIKSINYSMYDCILICHEKSKINLKNVVKDLRTHKNIAVIVGPEGGLDDKEVEEVLAQTNSKDILLGQRILRAETASLMILSILMYELD